MGRYTNYGKTLVVLLLGTVISLIIGIIVAGLYGSPNQYIIGLLSEVVVISASIGTFVYEINTQILKALHKKDIFVAAGSYAIHSKDPSFSEKYKLIEHQLKELSKGHYEIDDLPSVYADDIESIKILGKGERLCSMCPIGGSVEKVSEQFSNKSFTASMKQHFRAAGEGVIVQRLYIFESASLLEDVPECKQHLNEAVKHGLEARLIFLDDPRFKDAKRLPHDFIIFGSHKVSVGRVGPNSRVDGADIWASRERIEEYKQKFEQLVRQSERFKADEDL